MVQIKALVAYNGADAGLGNRMRVTLGAANLAKTEGRRFFYVWPTTPKFEPAIGELWHWSEGRSIPRSVSRAAAKITGYYDEHVSEIRADARRPLWQIRTGGVLRVPDGVTPWYETFRTLRPVDAIASLVTETFDSGLRGHSYVGVQIRVHEVSHRVTKDASPLEWFIARMDEMAAAGTRFYISCDVPQVKRDLLERYPGSVGLHCEAPYNSTRAVRYAVADLYLLASATRILGPHRSSFVQMAEYLTHPSVEAEKAREPERSADWSGVPLTVDPLRPADR